MTEKIKEAQQTNEKRQEILTRIKEVLVRRLNLEITPDKIDDDSPLFGMGLGLDSIDSLELVVGIEEEFGISVPSDKLEVFLSVNTVADFILGVERLSSYEVKCDEQSLARYPWLNAYKALREGCLMYDTNPVILEIPEQENALDFISWLVAGNDIVLEPNRAMVGLLLNENGRILDIIDILMFEEKFWFILSPENKETLSWILSKAADKSISINNVSETYHQVTCEGPYSWKLVKSFAGIEVTGLSYLHFMSCQWEGNPVLIYRAGRTNEYGFRMFLSPHIAEGFTAYLINAVSEMFFLYEKNTTLIKNCLVTALQEVRFPSLNITIMPGSSPVPNEIRWMVNTRKKDFIGREAVLNDFSEFDTRIVAVVALSNDEIDKEKFDGAEIFVDTEKIGDIVISNYSPCLNRWFGYGEFKKEFGYVGNRNYSMVSKDGSVVPLITVSTPLFLTKSAQTQME
ncbi:phosphopantetheine-binding protein [Treponema sp. J25]|uniref:phosphopantetheine-binding protein n=1 Tax=Treponema sp. J25 TaxID=2094121 RepID=UPI00104C8CB1|nr:phosphopantetheine-binding protein [Treponema sp. J25]MCX7656088.1 phosphopantetheine-binding protein [Treponemataceae bacterium]TCW62195.1 hypothetical protein C5O22_02895 [Treponema sp. J25]